MSYQENLSHTITLSIGTLTGKIFLLDVRVSDTVYQVKQQLYQLSCIPVAQQHLIYNDFTLHDPSPLSSYSIKSGTRLSLVFKMQGGHPCPSFLPSSESNDITSLYSYHMDHLLQETKIDFDNFDDCNFILEENAFDWERVLNIETQEEKKEEDWIEEEITDDSEFLLTSSTQSSLAPTPTPFLDSAIDFYSSSPMTTLASSSDRPATAILITRVPKPISPSPSPSPSSSSSSSPLLWGYPTKLRPHTTHIATTGTLTPRCNECKKRVRSFYRCQCDLIFCLQHREGGLGHVCSFETSTLGGDKPIE